MFFGHSTSVAALAERAAVQMGLSADDARSLRRAALLHDIGRLGVPNSIWTRPGRLDWGEMERVRLHAYYTERVLSPIRVLGPVAEIAASAHEHVDGSGYPQSRTGRSLLPAARILAAADIAIAMSEPRPHRPALNPDALARELVGEVDAGHVDAAAADAVLASMGVTIRIVSRHAHGVSESELEVCRLIARGKSNKEIADDPRHLAPHRAESRRAHLRQAGPPQPRGRGGLAGRERLRSVIARQGSALFVNICHAMFTMPND